jgi:hypothetical protein
MAGPVFALVDWGKVGTFVAAGDDVSDRLRGAMSCQYGRPAGSPSVIAAGVGSFDLDNTSRDYSPANGASPLFGNLKPARPVLLQRVVSATTYTLFRGHTSDTPIDPDTDTKRVTLNLIDGLADFQDVTITTGVSQGIRSGTAIGLILDAAGWTGGRDIDGGASVFPLWWEDGTDAYSALQKVVASEGPPALLAMGVSGEIIFRDRHHRLTRAASTTVQASFNGGASTSTEPVMQGMTYSGNWSSVVNNVQLSVDERVAARRGYLAVWQTDEVIDIGASASYVVIVQASDPFLGALAPVANVDYTLSAGSITGATLSRTSGQSTSITLTAGGGGATLQGLQLRALSAPVVRTTQITSSDSASILDYGAKGIPSGLEPVWCNRYDAKSIADLWVVTRKQPPVLVTARFVCHDSQTTKLAALLSLDLSDRVAITEAETVLAGSAFYVESIGHVVGDNDQGYLQHTIEITCEAVPAAPGAPFILGTSTLNGATTLAY